MTLQADLEAASAAASAAAEKLKAIVNGPAAGPGSTVATDSGDVHTAARAIADLEAAATAFEHRKGPQGPRGDTGERGPQGLRGLRGPRGPEGPKDGSGSAGGSAPNVG